MEAYCNLYQHKDLSHRATCLSSITDIFLENCPKSFNGIHVVETELSNFHNINLKEKPFNEFFKKI